MRNRCPAASGALGASLLLALLITLILPEIEGKSSCRVAQVEKAEAPNVKTRYCEPSHGCTFIKEYNDCVRDNEMPQCIYYSTLKQLCLLCYSASEPGTSGKGAWIEPDGSLIPATEVIGVPEGAKVCDKLPV